MEKENILKKNQFNQKKKLLFYFIEKKKNILKKYKKTIFNRKDYFHEYFSTLKKHAEINFYQKKKTYL